MIKYKHAILLNEYNYNNLEELAKCYECSKSELIRISLSSLYDAKSFSLCPFSISEFKRDGARRVNFGLDEFGERVLNELFKEYNLSLKMLVIFAIKNFSILKKR